MSFLSEDGIKSGEYILGEIGLSVEADDDVEERVNVSLGVVFEKLSLSLLVLLVEDKEVIDSLGFQGGILGGGGKLVKAQFGPMCDGL